MNGVVGQTLLLTQWQFRRQANMVPLLIVIQVFMALGVVIGYGLLVGDLAPELALLMATGAPTITLVIVGLIMTPQMLSQSKMEGSLDWMRTLPVPRVLFLISDLLVWSLIALPGMVLGIIAGVLRFDVDLSIAPWFVFATLLVSLTAASIGYGMASLVPPAVAQLLSQVLVFVILLFTPVSFPASRMPEWMQTAHEWLPFEPMAQLIRSGLASDTFSMPGRSLVVLLAWTLVSVLGANWALRRRV